MFNLGPIELLIVLSPLWIGLIGVAIARFSRSRQIAEHSSVARSSPAAAPAGWHADPSGRNELRFWDGITWTARASNDGVEHNDPI